VNGPDTGTGRRQMTIAVTSGKGGVGKTTVAVNLSIALARLEFQVGILDADFGLGNVDVMLGLTPMSHIGAVLTGEKALRDIGATATDGVRVFPAGSGIRTLTTLRRGHWARLRSAMADLSSTLDYLLVDTGPGIGDTTLKVAQETDRAIVVTTCEPTALVDAYAMTKLLIAASPHREIGLVVNMAPGAEQARLVARQIANAAHQFLGVGIRYYGFIERDPQVAESVLVQRPLMALDLDTPATRAFGRLARRIAQWARPPAGRPDTHGVQAVARPADTLALDTRSCA
jgi:flagellar biosynthesis protein FlhG